jgi:hypothetical protein
MPYSAVILVLITREKFSEYRPALSHEDSLGKFCSVSVRKSYILCKRWKYYTKVEATVADKGMRVIAGVY